MRDRSALIVVVAALAAVSAGTACASESRPATRPSAATPKLAASLAAVARAERVGGRGLATARSLGLVVRADKVRVVVQASGGRGAAVTAVIAAGGKVEAQYATLVQSLVAPGRLERLARSPGVAFVRPPIAAQIGMVD